MKKVIICFNKGNYDYLDLELDEYVYQRLFNWLYTDTLCPTIQIHSNKITYHICRNGISFIKEEN